MMHKPQLFAILIAALVLSACSDQAKEEPTGIPVSELPKRKSSLDATTIRAAVATSFPAKTYMSNEFLPKEGDFAQLAQKKPEALRKIRVGMPWTATDEFSPLYLAIELGYFKELGLEIEMVPGGPGRDHLKTLAGKQLDISITADGMYLPMFTASRTNADILAVGAFLKKNPVVYLSLDTSIPVSEKSTRVITAEDFANSTIGVIRGQTIYIEFLVDRFKLDPNQVRLRWTGATPDALISGVVDQWAAWILNQPRLLEQHGYMNWSPFYFHDLGWKQYCDVVVVRKETAENDSEMVRRFLAAIDKGVQFYLNQPEQSAEITSRYATGVNHTPADVMRRFTAEKELVLGDDGLPPLYMNPENWNDVTALLIEFGLIEDSILQQP